MTVSSPVPPQLWPGRGQSEGTQVAQPRDELTVPSLGHHHGVVAPKHTKRRNDEDPNVGFVGVEVMVQRPSGRNGRPSLYALSGAPLVAGIPAICVVPNPEREPPARPTIW